MNNLQELINDPELFEQLCIAYAMVGNRRAKIQYKLAILNMPDTHVFDDMIINTAMDTPSYLIDAITGFISEDWKG
jgi:hypothetical protein